MTSPHKSNKIQTRDSPKS